MTKPLTKVRICPTCHVGFKSSQVIRDGNAGWCCPQGHFHSQYEIARHAQGKPLGVGSGAQRGRRFVDVPSRPARGRAELLALLWIGAVDRLLAQLPARSMARAMVEGATAQAVAVSRKVLKEADAVETAERRAA